MRRVILLSAALLPLAASCGAALEVPAPGSSLAQSHPVVVAGDQRVGWAIVSHDSERLTVSLLMNPGFELAGGAVCASAGPFAYVPAALCPFTQSTTGTKATFEIGWQEIAPEGTDLCRAPVFLQVQATAVEAGSGAPLGSAYAGIFKGRIALAVECEPVPSYEGCTRNAAWWESAAWLWPVETLQVGDVRYRAEDLLALYSGETQSDASLILLRPLIAARLNAARGARMPEPVKAALSGAEAWMTTHRGDGLLPYAVKGTAENLPNPAAWDEAVNLAAVLDRYSNGRFGPPACAD